ncbi:MAG: peptidyl-prolyl cis-trans isomerase, partial [Elusimicrobiota bacterium]
MRHIALICTVMLALAASARGEEDRDVVSVNGTVIRQSEVLDRLWKRYGPATLEEMVDEIILRQAAQAQGIKANTSEVDKRLTKLRSQFNDPALFESQLKQSGSSLEKLRAEISEQLLMRNLILSMRKLTVKPEELQKAFSANREKLASPPAVHLRHILVKTETEAADLIARVKAGADFAALAKERSLAPTGKITGGDYGFVSQGMLPPEIDRIAFAMKSDEIRTVPSPKGHHILQVTEKRAAEPAKFEAVKDDLRDMLLEDKMKGVLPGIM